MLLWALQQCSLAPLHFSLVSWLEVFSSTCISKHQFHSSKTETSFYQQQQAAVPQQRAGPVYEEVVELKENVAYGPAQGIAMWSLCACAALIVNKNFYPNQQQHEHFKVLMNSVKSICLLCIANLVARILQYLMIELLWSLTSSFLILIASKHHLMIHVTVIKLTLASFSGHSQILSHTLVPRPWWTKLNFLGYCRKPAQKSMDVIRKILCNNYWSHNLVGPYHFGLISPRNLTSFTRPLLAACRLGTRLALAIHDVPGWHHKFCPHSTRDQFPT